MLSHIPFLMSTKDTHLLRKIYIDPPLVRMSLANLILKGQVNIFDIPNKTKLWIDPSIDIYDKWAKSIKANNKKRIRGGLVKFYRNYFPKDELADQQFLKSPNTDLIVYAVNELMTECAINKPHWISIPQLPITIDNSRNRVNKLLINATISWYNHSSIKPKLILPIILTNQAQVNLKINRDKIKQQITRNLQIMPAKCGIWIVESSLDDAKGSDTFGRRRFPNLIKFHREIKSILSENITTIGGPYWGLGLILWAKGLIDVIGIGLGRGFKYYPPDIIAMSAGKNRIAIPSLRRYVVVNRELNTWLKDTKKITHLDNNLLNDLVAILKEFESFKNDKSFAQKQIAVFYKEWLQKLEDVNPAGRSIALFQDLTNAYVMGKSIPDLPKNEAPARRPEKVAEQFMLNCL